MHEHHFPAFVADVIAIDRNIWAVGDDMYIFGDSDLPEEDCERIAPELDRIQREYGPRDHLKLAIIAYLRSTGRHSTVDELVAQVPTSLSENSRLGLECPMAPCGLSRRLVRLLSRQL